MPWIFSLVVCIIVLAIALRGLLYNRLEDYAVEANVP
jgi:hypothetical protein